MKRTLIALAATTLLGLGVVTAPAQAAVPSNGTITVTGSGSMTLKRDQATTSLSVSYLASTAKAAISQASATYNSVRDAIVAAGVKADNITTSGIALYPEYDYNQTSGTQVLRGYRATISMSAVSTVALAATALDTAVGIGGDAVQIGGVSFNVADPDAVTDTTRTKAIANARMKAKDYAKALGARLGRALKVVETQAAVPTPIYWAKAGAAGDSTVTMDPGSQKVTSTVTVTFRLLS